MTTTAGKDMTHRACKYTVDIKFITENSSPVSNTLSKSPKNELLERVVFITVYRVLLTHGVECKQAGVVPCRDVRGISAKHLNKMCVAACPPVKNSFKLFRKNFSECFLHLCCKLMSVTYKHAHGYAILRRYRGATSFSKTGTA